MATTKKTSLSFEERLAELETILEWFESDDVTLENSIAQFERGMTLASELQKDLSKAENKVEQIKQKFDQAQG